MRARANCVNWTRHRSKRVGASPMVSEAARDLVGRRATIPKCRRDLKQTIARPTANEHTTCPRCGVAIRSSKFRRTAAVCGAFAAHAVSPADRALLLRMQRSRLNRAQHEDWLDGLPPTPPARSNALAVPRRS